MFSRGRPLKAILAFINPLSTIGARRGFLTSAVRAATRSGTQKRRGSVIWPAPKCIVKTDMSERTKSVWQLGEMCFAYN